METKSKIKSAYEIIYDNNDRVIDYKKIDPSTLSSRGRNFMQYENHDKLKRFLFSNQVIVFETK